jgi:hypothetical protein
MMTIENDVEDDFAETLHERSDTENLLSELSSAFDEAEASEDESSGEVAKAETPSDTRTAAERARDEKGRFAREAKEAADKVAGKAPDAASPTADKAGSDEGAEIVPQGASEAGQPPTSWSPTAKAAFASLPVEVQQAVAKREQEVNAGFAQLKEYKDLRPFAELAKRKGDTLGGYLQRLVQAEHVLETNPVEGLKWLMGNLRVDPRQLMSALGVQAPAPVQQAPVQPPMPQFVPPQPPEGVDPRREDWQQHVRQLYNRHVAYYQQQAAAQRPQAPVSDPRLEEVTRKLAEMERRAQAEEARRQEEARRPLVNEVEQFMGNTKEYPYAQNLRDEMAILLEAGKAETLKDAYEMAAWANPETRALLIKQQREEAVKPLTDRSRTAVSKARAASRSISGAPLPGASKTSNSSDMSIEDELRANWG